MSDREDLKDWIVHAIRVHGGRATIVEICKHIWENHESDLRSSGNLFYTWQYDMRWAGQMLRDNGILRPAHSNRSGLWELV